MSDNMSKVKCECGSEILLKNMAQHVKTQKHLNFGQPKMEKVSSKLKVKLAKPSQSDLVVHHDREGDEGEDFSDEEGLEGDDRMGDEGDDGVDEILKILEAMSTRQEEQHQEVLDALDAVIEYIGLDEDVVPEGDEDADDDLPLESLPVAEEKKEEKKDVVQKDPKVRAKKSKASA